MFPFQIFMVQDVQQTVRHKLNTLSLPLLYNLESGLENILIMYVCAVF